MVEFSRNPTWTRLTGDAAAYVSVFRLHVGIPPTDLNAVRCGKSVRFVILFPFGA